MTPSEQEYQIAPIVQDSVMHNTRVRSPTLGARLPSPVLLTVVGGKTLSNLQTLTASLFGVAAGILGLESYSGFLFYLAFSFLVTGLFYGLRVAPKAASSGKGALDTSRYFRGPFEFWTGGLSGGLAGFILTWTLFYGLIRA